MGSRPPPAVPAALGSVWMRRGDQQGIDEHGGILGYGGRGHHSPGDDTEADPRVEPALGRPVPLARHQLRHPDPDRPLPVESGLRRLRLRALDRESRCEHRRLRARPLDHPLHPDLRGGPGVRQALGHDRHGARDDSVPELRGLAPRLRAPGLDRRNARQRPAGRVASPDHDLPDPHPGAGRVADGDVRGLLETSGDLLPEKRACPRASADGRPPARARRGRRRVPRSRVRRRRRRRNRALRLHALPHTAARRPARPPARRPGQDAGPRGLRVHGSSARL